ncbi:hypothetical protein DMN91_003724 [Ooceraea biroi]|uniref:Lysosome-associated membrane glycoprotein 2-like luminal domain-containing protein n=1 Tax=Ooceraea biroi TaxID=2015173 RepID=A0A3L8DUD8_OOCBI|nr:integumentary mucin A.1 [Ooceraea biroi]RLU23519.1 hypothetical protein DMN91_003724 [Ooceraea biroi]
MSSTQSEISSTYSDIPSFTSLSPTQSTTRQSTSLKTTTSATTTMKTTLSITSFATTIMILTTDITTEEATSTTAAPETSLETSSQVPSKVTSTIETTDTSTTNARTIKDTTTATTPSQVSTDSSSTIFPPTSILSTTEITTFNPNTTTEGTSVSTTGMTTAIDEDTRDCIEFAVINFNYIVRHATTNVACILINMKMWINLQYTMEDSQIGKARLMVPTKVRTTGDCDEKRAKITLSWDEPTETRTDKNDDKENRISFHYAHNDVTFFLDSVFVDIHLDSNNFPRARQNRISGGGKDLQLFHAPVKDGIFVCTMDTVINIENQITAVTSDVRLIVFNNCSKSCWKTVDNCISKTSVNVSAIVGAGIIGILLIFIIFYLVWRKRKTNFVSFKTFTDYSFSQTIVLRKWLYLDKNHRES